MEAGQATADRTTPRVPAWLAGVLLLAILGVAIGLFVALGAPGLERNGIPVEEITVERSELRPGEIELSVRNDGPDAVAVRQVLVNDAFVGFDQTAPQLGRLDTGKITIDYPWVEGEAYEVALVTATGGTGRALDRRRDRDPAGQCGLLPADGPRRALRRGDTGRDRHAGCPGYGESTGAGCSSCSH